jgi:hypothetical protein
LNIFSSIFVCKNTKSIPFFKKIHLLSNTTTNGEIDFAYINIFSQNYPICKKSTFKKYRNRILIKPPILLATIQKINYYRFLNDFRKYFLKIKDSKHIKVAKLSTNLVQMITLTHCAIYKKTQFLEYITSSNITEDVNISLKWVFSSTNKSEKNIDLYTMWLFGFDYPII